MKNKMFSLRDQKVRVFSDPFCAPTTEAAMRGLKSMVDSGKGDLGMYPADFDLYEVGEFDQEKGTAEVYPQPLHVISLLVFKDNVTPVVQ